MLIDSLPTKATSSFEVSHSRPPEALVLNAIEMGRARGAGNMPAGIYVGKQAEDVAKFVAAVAGR